MNTTHHRAEPGEPRYISASRRTDLPRFFFRQFFAAWREGEISYDGGYGRSYTVSLRPEHVLGYLFWSKDFKQFIGQTDFGELIRTSNAVFGFTINDMQELEPNVPALAHRIDTLKSLCDRVGSDRVVWRYDPVCKYRDGKGRTVISEEPFYRILPKVRAAGVSRCIFSFMTLYPKLRHRPAIFEEFSDEEKTGIGSRMLCAARESGMTLSSCCNPAIPDLVPGVHQACCVDNELLRKTDRFGTHRDLKPKPTRSGCGCFESRDIGSYSLRCGHGCIYCYANPC